MNPTLLIGLQRNAWIDARPKGIENADGKVLVTGLAMRVCCKSRHMGPFSIGIHRTGQFRCESCDAVLSGVEVYLDTTEHAADGRQALGAHNFAVSLDAVPLAQKVLTREPLVSMS
jgi:hypothetical protein